MLNRRISALAVLFSCALAVPRAQQPAPLVVTIEVAGER